MLFQECCVVVSGMLCCCLRVLYVVLLFQGPLPETFSDFWRMVWEQRSATVVMMTKLEERARVSVHPLTSVICVIVTGLDMIMIPLP